MAIVLGAHQYGKAEIRLVRVVRRGERHELVDLSVSTALRGDFAAAHLEGDQRTVLPTDTQKNTAYVWARRSVPDPIESWAMSLARHFVDDLAPVTAARVEVERFDWQRAEVGGAPHDHTFVRSGPEVRTAAVTVGPDAEHVVQGLKDLVLLKTTGSAFRDFLVDDLTTLEPTDDRILATSLTARWRWTDPDPGTDWNAAAASVRETLVAHFATLRSLALQQTLWHMGRAVLEEHPGIAEIRLSAPNKHHFVVDFTPFGEPNPDEVFFAADRPYGLIEASAIRDDAPPAGDAWLPYTGLA